MARTETFTVTHDAQGRELYEPHTIISTREHAQTLADAGMTVVAQGVAYLVYTGPDNNEPSLLDTVFA